MPLGQSSLAPTAPTPGAEQVAHHLFKPASVQSFDVVVDQAHDLAAGGRYGKVVELRKVKRTGHVQDLDALLAELAQIGFGLRLH